MSTLRITEIFYSLQGETTLAGLPTVFVRLTGCPLRCVWCDSEYAFHGGKQMTISDIINEVREHQTPYVTVTGGEPLAQKNVHQLLSQLCDAHYTVSLETSGALSAENVDSRVIKIMDLKAPDSGEELRNLWQNLHFLQKKDQIKCVIASEKDYLWLKDKIKKHQLSKIVDNILVSPAFGKIAADQLAEWILRDQLTVRFQLQLHKQIWGEKPGV